MDEQTEKAFEFVLGLNVAFKLMELFNELNKEIDKEYQKAIADKIEIKDQQSFRLGYICAWKKNYTKEKNTKV